MKFGLLALGLALTPVVFNSRFAGAQTSSAPSQIWEGDGAEFTPDGKQVGSYHSVTTLRDLAPGTKESVTKIKSSDGSEKTITQKIMSQGEKFKIESNLGFGGGACYGEGLCEAYIDAGSGKGYATTVVVDSSDVQRHLTVVLENGNATRILRDKVRLTK